MANGTNGLALTEDEFARMKPKDQMLVLYRNTRSIHTKLATVEECHDVRLKKVERTQGFLAWSIGGLYTIAAGIIAFGMQHIMKG